jgi:hypothetical protein
MSQTMLIRCDGCGATKEESAIPVLVSELHHHSQSIKWAVVQIGNTDSLAFHIERLDYCPDCWIVAHNAVVSANREAKQAG